MFLLAASGCIPYPQMKLNNKFPFYHAITFNSLSQNICIITSISFLILTGFLEGFAIV